MRSTGSKRKENISTQVQSLNEMKKKILELEDELAKAREKQDYLETEIAYHHTSKAPINRLPPETLPMIFEEYGKQWHPQIRRLMLVCRQWHELILNSPRLWSYIQIELAYLSTPNQLNSAFKYSGACLSRSKSCLLHIAMDFSHFPNKFEHIDNIISDAFDNLLDNQGTWVQAVDYDRLEVYDLAYDRDTGKCASLVKRLASQNERWETLDIAFGTGEPFWIFDEVWPELPKSTPNLAELVMEGVEIPSYQALMAVGLKPSTSLR